jgi:Tol biopolymer transport system component
LILALASSATASPGTTTRVSVSSDGGQASGSSVTPAVSDDGRFVAFNSNASNLVPNDTNSVNDVFVHDLETRATTRVSVDSLGNEASAQSLYPDISADGRFVAFPSEAPNLVPGDTNGAFDIFVHDRLLGATERVSVDSAEAQANAASSGNPYISGDGRFVVFDSAASNLVPGDTNAAADIFVRALWGPPSG